MGNTTNKSLVTILVNTLAAKGLKHVVASPGSRNAPLLIAFQRHPSVEVISIPDERSAAFFALGMAQYTDLPTALICTSGTAGLNYSPAMAEAFYQGIPLLAITADRPTEYVHQEDGQTINQQRIFKNFTKSFFQFPLDEEHLDNHWYANRIANEAYNQCVHPNLGPVHINVPLREPLYQTTETNFDARTIEVVISSQGLYPETENALRLELNEFRKILILCGQIRPKEELAELVKKASLRSDVVVLSESISNFTGENVIPCIDRTLISFGKKQKEAFVPDLLITFDGPVISKKIKAFLRLNLIKDHWHIGPNRTDLDTFHALSKAIVCSRTYFVEEVLNKAESKASSYATLWHNQYQHSQEKHRLFINKAPWSDLIVFKSIIDHLPEDIHLQLGNSSVVRYFQLFDHYPSVPQYSNRGTSGIDGCTSTAAGYAHISKKMTLLITGDISFFYDTNGLWHHHISPDLRIILINNGGGGIFKIIEGPNSVDEKDDFFVTKQQANAINVAAAYGLSYQRADDMDSLQNILEIDFYKKSESAKILEVFSNEDSDLVLKDYFKYLE
ncbi:MAG: 2-succinyl-5-enolpyruvyl-6-hydroxy-3-cyclohexene-1-carboxylic-acid synthase [Saprospiraceae bacterium]|nr:2-succinyl-5-enolpyruvyl-6-hydroxy-3-cyclohexene-1-carboxylic-acid synthase [Saprospiraceae bacterium]